MTSGTLLAADTNGIESFWATLKKGYHGIYHHMSAKYLARYVTEFAGRHIDRPLDTTAQMRRLAQRMSHKRLENIRKAVRSLPRLAPSTRDDQPIAPSRYDG